MFKFFDGKKTLIGLIVAELPGIIESVGRIIAASGADSSDYARVSGTLIAVLGLVHKFLKGEAK